MKKPFGRFYFKLTDSKNLIGEFSNSDSARNYTESADLISRKPEDVKFVGNYISTWQENEEPLFANLTISLKGGGDGLLNLEWRRNNQPIFEGQGMLCEGLLIGDYHGVKS